MTPSPGVSIAPPRWAERALRAWLPDDPLRDAIVGDLHEELVRDAARLGADRARMRYRRRVGGIVAYVLLDLLRWRPWHSASMPVPVAAVGPIAPTAASRDGRALVRGADLGLIAGAFGVLGVGIIANTVLFSTVRHVPDSSLASPAMGVVAVLLALGSAAVAAIMLCVGPRWLRRRTCDGRREHANPDRTAHDR